MDFDVYFIEPNGSYNHSIVDAPRMSVAVSYIESTKKAEVYKANKRDTSQKSSGPLPLILR